MDPLNPNMTCPNCDATATLNSVVQLQSGAVAESQNLVSYQSLGTTNTLTLSYNSLWADPQPIVHFGYENVVSDPNVQLVADLAVSRGDFTYQQPGFQLRTPQSTDSHDHVYSPSFVTNPTQTISFSGTAGQLLLIDNVLGESGAAIHFQVLAPDQSVVLQSAVVPGAGVNQSTPFSLPATGTYTIQVSGQADDSSQFELRDVSNLGLSGGENFFSIPQVGGTIDAVLQVDLRWLPSGVYDYALMRGCFDRRVTASRAPPRPVIAHL